MRLKSNAIWHSLPGVEAVYQSIGAPSAVDALLNVAHDHRSAGKYTATPGVLPEWSPSMGWKGGNYGAGGRWLDTGIIPKHSQDQSLIVRASAIQSYSKAAGTSDAGQFGVFLSWFGSGVIYENGGSLTKSPEATSMTTLGFAGNIAYRDGVAESETIPGWGGGTNTKTMYLFTENDGTPRALSGLYLLSFAYFSRVLTPAEMWLASRQMTYCEQNPDWNAWGRRRNYYFASSAAAIRWPGVGRGGPVGGSPGIRGSQQ